MNLQPFFDSFGQVILMPYALIVIGVAVCVLAVKKIDRAGGRANLRLPAILVGLTTIGYGLLILFTAQR